MIHLTEMFTPNLFQAHLPLKWEKMVRCTPKKVNKSLRRSAKMASALSESALTVYARKEKLMLRNLIKVLSFLLPKIILEVDLDQSKIKFKTQ